MTNKFLVAGLMAAAAAIPALAQPAPVAPPAPPAPVAPSSPLRILPMGDGVLTRQEVQTMVQNHFQRMDANKDGAIAENEMTMGHARMMRHGGPGGDKVRKFVMRDGPGGDPNAAFDRLDANKDGAISRDEFAKGREIRIEKRVMLDKDGKQFEGQPMHIEKHLMLDKDGKEMHVAPGEHLGGNVFIHRTDKGPRPGGRAMRMVMGGGAMFKMADSNKDGRVTLQEATAGALAHFDKVDANRDGRVTPEERRAVHGKMREVHVIRS